MMNVNMIHGTLPFTRVDLGPAQPVGPLCARPRRGRRESSSSRIAIRPRQAGAVEHDDVLALFLASRTRMATGSPTPNCATSW